MKAKSFKKHRILIRIPVSSRPGKVILPLKGKGSYRRPSKDICSESQEDQSDDEITHNQLA